jgi:hypothetical protein
MTLPTSPRSAVRSSVAAASLWVAAVAAPAHAAVVQAQLNPLGGNAWSAAFTVGATGAQVIESFTIYLDAAFARNVVIQVSPAQWDTLAVQADTGLASDAFVDVLLIGGNGITAASPSAGPEITFDWLGTTAPAALRFTVNDPLSFVALETGTTVPLGSAVVPEPASWALLALSLGLAAAVTRSRHL